jgi:hypothetical protein
MPETKGAVNTGVFALLEAVNGKMLPTAIAQLGKTCRLNLNTVPF